MTPGRLEQLHLMQEISKREFGSIWKDGLEYYLWRAISGAFVPRMYNLSISEVSRLQHHYRAERGWWVYDEYRNEPIFISATAWRKEYELEWDDWVEI